MSIVLISGPIASGKSAIGRALADRLHAMGQAAELIDLDDEVLEMHGSFDWAHERDRRAGWLEARRVAAGRADAAIAMGKQVVVSGPFYAQEEIDGLTSHLASGVPVFLYVLETPLAIRLKRNRARARVSPDAELIDQDAAISGLPKVFGSVVPNKEALNDTVADLMEKLSRGIDRLQQGEVAGGT